MHSLDSHEHALAADPGLAIDPVCKMTVDPSTAKHAAEVDGVQYYFCAPGCKKSFVADPSRYLTTSSAAAPAGVTLLQMSGGCCGGGSACSCP